MKKRDEMRGIVEAEMKAAHITEWEIKGTGGGHRKLLFSFGGRMHNVFFPSTPSDRRASLNMRSFIRRELRT